MRFMDLYDEYLKLSSKESLIKYRNHINKLMSGYQIEDITFEKMNEIMAELDVLTYTTDIAYPTEKLKELFHKLQVKKTCLKKYFKINSSTLFKLVKGAGVSLKFANSLCEKNNMNLNDYFIIISDEHYYTLETKKRICQSLKSVIGYAYDKKLTFVDISKMNYLFTMSKESLSDNLITAFVNGFYNHKCLSEQIEVLLLLLLDFDSNKIVNLKAKDIDIINNKIIVGGKSISFTSKVKLFLTEFCNFMTPNEFVLGNGQVPIKEKSLNTAVYRIASISNTPSINKAIMQQYQSRFLKAINNYENPFKKYSDINLKNLGLNTAEELDDLIDFLSFQKQRLQIERGE